MESPTCEVVQGLSAKGAEPASFNTFAALEFKLNHYRKERFLDTLRARDLNSQELDRIERHGVPSAELVVNLPNSLTISRIFIVPLLVVVLLTPLAENWLGVPRHILGVTIFLAAALTDYLDGHLARSRDQVSRLGKLLDPIADKLLISGALISLVENRLAPAWAVVIIVGRELAVTGLRSIAASDGYVISASRMGKFKMLAQVVTVALLIVSSASGQPPVTNFGQPFPAIQFWTVPELRSALQHLFGAGVTTIDDWRVLVYTTGRAMLWVVVLTACFSMYGYFRAFYRAVVGRSEHVRDAKRAVQLDSNPMP